MEKASLPRITARVDLETQALLKRAASLSGISSINSFVLNCAIEKAKQVIEREEVLRLTEEDAMRLVSALEHPAQENAKLKSAFYRHQEKSNADSPIV
jgi:uncharacterized protein (DUF1778 family)